MSEDQLFDEFIKRTGRAVLVAATAAVLTFLQSHVVFAWWKIGLAFALMSVTRAGYRIALLGLAFLFALVVISPEFTQAIWSSVTRKQ